MLRAFLTKDPRSLFTNRLTCLSSLLHKSVQERAPQPFSSHTVLFPRASFQLPQSRSRCLLVSSLCSIPLPLLPHSLPAAASAVKGSGEEPKSRSLANNENQSKLLKHWRSEGDDPQLLWQVTGAKPVNNCKPNSRVDTLTLGVKQHDFHGANFEKIHFATFDSCMDY